MMNSVLNMMDHALKRMNSVLNMMDYALKMMNSVLNMMNYAFKRMDYALKRMNLAACGARARAAAETPGEAVWCAGWTAVAAAR